MKADIACRSFASLPGAVPEGSTSNALIGHVDLMATIAAVCRKPAAIDGRQRRRGRSPSVVRTGGSGRQEKPRSSGGRRRARHPQREVEAHP